MQNVTMWSNLKKLLADRLGTRPKRRAAPPRFRGQFEPLESRTVLSATIGVMAIDADVNTVTIVVWQTAANPSDWLPKAVDNGAPSLAFGSINSAWHPGGGERLFHQNTTGLLGDVRVDAGGVSEKLPVRATAPQNDKAPVRATAPTEPDAATGALALNFNSGPNGGFVKSAITQVRYARTLPTDTLAYDTAFATSSTPAASLSQSSSRATTNAAFDKYAADSLLLTTATGPRDVDSLDDKFGDADSFDDEEPATDATSSFAAEEVAASLDALQRERKAIDEVLAELHEITPGENTQQQSSEDIERRQDDSRFVTPEYYSADERAEREQESTPADGMVLLQPTGDANSSAYDLTDVFFARLGGDDQAPLAVEASLGMYQAIDVGNDSHSAASRAQLPIAQPGQTVRPSVSAENAPAKKSEQPS